ncbi:Hypothetical predicted protein [Olea europaea subsp. europaea]|uniref:Uncharacterized protein n=1 Tax=Olea europaea subsp. europaea TaxID=158383 RepID=A0A8S0PJW9_OLEEU|nr:Hypothetical predicted protein [Olea europaea subsp. europaea]
MPLIAPPYKLMLLVASHYTDQNLKPPYLLRIEISPRPTSYIYSNVVRVKEKETMGRYEESMERRNEWGRGAHLIGALADPLQAVHLALRRTYVSLNKSSGFDICPKTMSAAYSNEQSVDVQIVIEQRSERLSVHRCRAPHICTLPASSLLMSSESMEWV